MANPIKDKIATANVESSSTPETSCMVQEYLKKFDIIVENFCER